MNNDEVFRVLVTGSRQLSDPDIVYKALNTIWEEVQELDLPVVVVHGACPKGADKYAANWCKARTEDVTEEAHPADWDRYGKAAGFRRNSYMVSLGADICLAFISGPSRGTRHCAGEAKKAGISMRYYEEAE